MRPRLLTATAAVLLLALTGCSATTGGAPDAAESTPAATVETTPAPLVAETTDAPTAPVADTPEAQFVAIVRDTWTKMAAETQIPNATNEQLIDAGHKACEQLATDPQIYNVRVVDGEQPDAADYYNDSAVIAGNAVKFFCPEITPQYN